MAGVRGKVFASAALAAWPECVASPLVSLNPTARVDGQLSLEDTCFGTKLLFQQESKSLLQQLPASYAQSCTHPVCARGAMQVRGLIPQHVADGTTTEQA